ncbi:MAG: hypothetical protein HZA62_02240 [Rhodocyclales bacterium]|nr:hypothetical protein [Rhodocyclales bacterium]
MQVVHFSLTPLAGSPIRIVNALRQHTSWQARLIVLDPAAYGTRTFEGDLDWNRDREEALSCIDSADILHLHHYFDLEHNPFDLDFASLRRRGKQLVRQFHSGPFHIAGGQLSRAAEIIQSPLPQVVVAQYQERYFPNARVVPNLVPLRDELCSPSDVADHSATLKVFFAPSSPHSAWKSSEAIARWENKGAPETVAMLERLCARNPFVVADIRRDMPHADCLRARQAADVSIDDLVTGSFHLSSLEGLAQGVPTMAFLDPRTLSVLAEMAGTSTHPWINCRLENAEDSLLAFASDPDARKALGQASRDWMTRYWNDRELVRHFTDAYERVLETDGAPFPARFDPDKLQTWWKLRARQDLAWQLRRWRHRLAEVAISRLGS